MKSSRLKTPWIWIFNLGFFIIFIGNVKFANSFEEFWQEMQPATQGLINSYITMCEKKGKSFDSEQMEEDMNNCVSSNLERIMKPIISNNGENPRKIALAIRDLKMLMTLTSEQVDLLGKNIVEPACQLLPAMMICSKPYQYPLIKSCSENPDVEKIILDYIEVVIQATCKFNGNRVVDFIAASGMTCISLISEGLECFKNVSSKEMTIMDTGQLCKLLAKAHACLGKSFIHCGGTVTQKILNLILDDVKTWVSNMCETPKEPSEVKKAVSEAFQVRSQCNFILPIFILQFVANF